MKGRKEDEWKEDGRKGGGKGGEGGCKGRGEVGKEEEGKNGRRRGIRTVFILSKEDRDSNGRFYLFSKGLGTSLIPSFIVLISLNTSLHTP